MSIPVILHGQKPKLTAQEVGAVPTTRKVNNKALSSDIALNASDVRAVPINAYDGDMDALVADGHYRVWGNANLPTEVQYGQVIVSRGWPTDNNTVSQIAISYNKSIMYFRSGYLAETPYKWTEWARVYNTKDKPTANDVGALPITGGTITGYEIGLLNGYGAVWSGNDASTLSSIDTPGDGSNRRLIYVKNHSSPLKDAIQLMDVVDGNYVPYNIYGSHNKPTPSEIGALYADNSIVTNIDTISQDGIYAIGLKVAGTFPANTHIGILVNKVWDVNYSEQLFFSFELPKLYIRHKHNNEWRNWRYIYDTSNKPTPEEIAFLGSNLGTQATDTTATWASRGTGYAHYDVANLINNQPTQYGMLVQWIKYKEVVQIWFSQPGGGIYTRRGNQTGWYGGTSDNGTWKRVYDTQYITSGTSALTAGSSALTTGQIYLQYE